MDYAASIVVLPGSPEVAKEIQFSVKAHELDAKYELYFNGTHLLTVEGDGTWTHSAAGLEAELANFGSAGSSKHVPFVSGVICGAADGFGNLIEVIKL